MKNGQNMRDKYLLRIREEGGSINVLCNKCEMWHDHSNFHKSKGKFKSICKDCHKSRYSVSAGYRTPSAIRNSEQSKIKRNAWLSEVQTCKICGSKRPRKEFYNERQKAYLPFCCSNRRTWDQIELDIKEQMKTCFECGLRLSFDEFADGGNGRDKKKPYCKCCQAAKVKISTDKPERLKQIIATDDGTATVQAISKMLRETENCTHCGVKMTQDYPVTPSNKTVDHDVPLSRGGKHTLSNITIMCLSCNSSKQSRTLDEFSKVKKKIGFA